MGQQIVGLANLWPKLAACLETLAGSSEFSIWRRLQTAVRFNLAAKAGATQKIH